MSILIKGMEMPTSCMLCSFCVEEADPANGEMCMVTGKLMPPCTRVRLDDCPLVPVPPHGGLVDANRLIEIGLNLMHIAKNDDIAIGVKWLWQYILEAPTVIEAEEG